MFWVLGQYLSFDTQWFFFFYLISHCLVLLNTFNRFLGYNFPSILSVSLHFKQEDGWKQESSHINLNLFNPGGINKYNTVGKSSHSRIWLPQVCIWVAPFINCVTEQVTWIFWVIFFNYEMGNLRHLSQMIVMGMKWDSTCIMFKLVNSIQLVLSKPEVLSQLLEYYHLLSQCLPHKNLSIFTSFICTLQEFCKM